MIDMECSIKQQIRFMFSENYRSNNFFLNSLQKLFNSRILFIFRHPKSVDAMNVFLSPFVDVVWLLIFVIGIVTSILIRNIFLCENRLTAKSNWVPTTKNDDTYFNSFLMVFGILFQQGCTSGIFSHSLN